MAITDTRDKLALRIASMATTAIHECVHAIGGAPVAHPVKPGHVSRDTNTVRAALLSEYERRMGVDALDALMAAIGLGVPDPSVPMRPISVCFQDSRYNYDTTINGTREEIARHFSGLVNVGDNGLDNLQHPVRIIFQPSAGNRHQIFASIADNRNTTD